MLIMAVIIRHCPLPGYIGTHVQAKPCICKALLNTKGATVDMKADCTHCQCRTAPETVDSAPHRMHSAPPVPSHPRSLVQGSPARPVVHQHKPSPDRSKANVKVRCPTRHGSTELTGDIQTKPDGNMGAWGTMCICMCMLSGLTRHSNRTDFASRGRQNTSDTRKGMHPY